MKENRFYDTRYIPYFGKKFCVYCGKEIEHFTEVDGYDIYEHYNCSCEDANKEHELNVKMENLEHELEMCKYNLPKAKYGIVTNFTKLPSKD